ncbi:MAG: hypothetical protein ACI9N1_002248 [Flavobacteriales bacterium]|jgi:hypothetical protein
MIIYQSNTFTSETNLVVTAIYGTHHILEVHHTEEKEIHQVAQFSLTEWKSDSHKVHIIHTNTSFEALPSSLAEENLVATIGSVLNSERKSNKTTLSDFTILFDVADAHTGKPIILSESHLAALLIEKSMKSAEKGTDLLSISIWDHGIFLALIQNEQLINCNRFDCADAAEAMYYTMLFVQEYDLNQETLNCNVYGDISATGTFGSELKQYIRNVNINRKGILPSIDIDGVLSLIFDTI